MAFPFLGILAMLMTGSIITSIGMCLRKIISLNEPKYLLFSFVDCDMLMHYYWGFGVGHAYAYDNTELPEETMDNNGAAMNASILPEINTSDCHVDWDGDDTDSQSLASSPGPDHSCLDDVDIEIAAMYDWDSQDEGDEKDYKF